MSDSERVMDILRQAKLLAREYRQLTGKPLGVTGKSLNTKLLESLILNSHQRGRRATTPKKDQMA